MYNNTIQNGETRSEGQSFAMERAREKDCCERAEEEEDDGNSGVEEDESGAREMVVRMADRVHNSGFVGRRLADAP